MPELHNSSKTLSEETMKMQISFTKRGRISAKFKGGPILKLVTLGENRIFANNRFPVSCKVI